MRSYTKRVRNSILPLSVGKTLPEAFEEWSFTEETIDHEEAIETCQLCGQMDLRYHFEIRNSLTKNTLWVGSHCILKFGVSVFEDGELLSEIEANKKLKRLTQQMRLNSCLKALRLVAEKENNEILNKALEYYTKNKYLTPKFGFVVLWRLKANNIDHSATFFKISLKKGHYKNDLKEMNEFKIKMIWPALSSAQRKIAKDLNNYC